MFCETLMEAKDLASTVLKDRKAILANPTLWTNWRCSGLDTMQPAGIQYGETARFNCQSLASLNGKGTRACFHVTIQRHGMDDLKPGWYEVNAYVS